MEWVQWEIMQGRDGTVKGYRNGRKEKDKAGTKIKYRSRGVGKVKRKMMPRGEGRGGCRWTG